MNTKVTLIDSGQDFQIFICDDTGKIIEVHPEPNIKSIWIGSFLPINDKNLMQEGKYCAIRKAYSNSFGYLRHLIQKIEKI
ncbi:MAG: hypothetical protein PHQ67_11215 [Fermentimonas sp.]|nr:hypothetical protein [Fermentimonas sp.]